MKIKIKYLFVPIILFLFICNVSAKEKIVCTYETVFTNEWEISYDRKYEMHLTLNNNEVTLDKVIVSSNPKDMADCKEKACMYANYEGCADQMCKKSVGEGNYKVDFSIKEGDGCPKSLSFYHNSTIVEDKQNGVKLSSQKKTYTNKVYCGSENQGRITGIPKKIPELTSTVVTIIQIAIPIILVLFGSIDLFKGITAGKEDEIKKGQQMFIKRLIVGALIFFVVVIVKFLISVIAETNKDNISDCIDCFISNDCKEM